MGVKRVAVTFTLAAALILSGQPAWAEGHHGRGGRHGGGYYGGSHAVPRGGGYAGGAYGRHRRAGTGVYGHYYGGHRYGPYYGRHHGSYYYDGHYGYSRPYGYASLYFGWPHVSLGWSWPYYGAYAPVYDSTYYGYRYADPEARPAYDQRTYERPYGTDRSYHSDRSSRSYRDTGDLHLEVSPDDASVYVDDAFWGTAREAKRLTLRSGRHVIEAVRPGFETVRRDVDVVTGETIEMQVELRRQ
jgi:hypothetical protein